MPTPQKMPAKRSLFSNGYFVLALLLCAYILSFIDRNIMAILVTPIREEFDISDFEFGILNGVAFSLLYTFIGIPLAWLADRKSRKNIIAIGTGFWSLMTLGCGLATGFYSLFTARMGVGVGEAALSPPAHSLLSDYFPKEKLPTIMAIFTLGIPVGIGISYSLGGWVYGIFAEQSAISIPLIGALKPWQATFMMVGLPGFVLALFISRIHEPQRTGLLTTPLNEEDKNNDNTQTLSIRQVFSFLYLHRAVYFNVFFSIACLSIVGYGFMMWFVEHMSRSFEQPAHKLSQSFGLMYSVAGTIGTLSGAAFSTFLLKRGYADAGIRLILIVAMAWFIPAIAAPLMPSLTGAQLMAIPYIFLLNSYFGVSIAALQIITPNQMRAQVSAVLLFMTNVFGLVVGPMFIGFLSDSTFSFANSQSLGFALSTVGGVFCCIAALLLLAAMKPYQRLLKITNESSV